jgi:hypothetical protein
MSFSRVLVQGQQLAELILFSTRTGNNGLSEAPFAHDGLTIAQAKAAWTPSDWRSPGLVIGAAGDDNGTCTCPSTTTVTVTSANASQTWASNYWDASHHEGTVFLAYSSGTTVTVTSANASQTWASNYWDASHHEGTVFLAYSSGTTITTYATRGVTANTSLSAGGTSTLTVDRALPHLLYDHYVLTGSVGGASAVWCVYQLPSWAAAKVAPQASWASNYRAPGAASGMLTSTALGSVLWSSSGSPPYSSYTVGVAVDPVTGYVHFTTPTYVTAGNKTPSEVRALVPIYVDVNQVASPVDVLGVPQYAGQLHSVEGLDRTLPVYCPGWRDPGNAAAVQAWADELLTSVQDPVEEGVVTVLGLDEGLMVMGTSLELAGTGYATPWSGTALPVLECQLEWQTQPGTATDYVTTARCSSRKSHHSVEAFLHPDRTGVTFDWSGSVGAGDWGHAMQSARLPDANQALGGMSVSDLPSNVGSMVNPAGMLDMSTNGIPNPGAGGFGGTGGGADAAFKGALGDAASGVRDQLGMPKPGGGSDG